MEGFIPDDQFQPDTVVPANETAQHLPQAPQGLQPAQAGATADFIPDDQFQSDEDKYGTTGQMAITALEGAAHGVAGPLATLAEKHVLGVPEEDIRGRQETNPVTYGLGQAAGLGAGLLTGTGEAALMVKAGELAAGAAGLGKVAEGASLGYKVGSQVVAQAAEMAVLQSGDEVSKMILNDPNVSVETAIGDIGLAAALGGATGGLIEGTVKPLWNATAGPKVNDLLTKLTSHMNGQGAILPGEVDNAVRALGIEVTPELRAAMSGDPKLIEHFKTLKYAQNPEVLGNIERLQKDASDSVLNSLRMTPEDVLVHSEADAGHELLDTFKKEFKTKYGPMQEAFDKRNAEAAKIFVPDEARLRMFDKMYVEGMEKVGTDSPYFKLYDDFGNRMLAKDTVGGMDMLKTEINNSIKSARAGADYNTANALGDIKRMINDLQESEILKQSVSLERQGAEYGSALGRDLVRERQELNRQYSDFAKMSDELTNHLGVGDFYGAKTLENKLENKVTAEQLLNKFSFKNNADFIPFLQQNFPETLAKVQDSELKRFLKPAMLSAKGENAVNINRLSDMVDKGMAGKKEYVEQILSKESLEKIKAAKTVIDALPNPKDSGTPGGLAKVLKNMPQSAMAGIGALMGQGAHGVAAGGLGGALVGEMVHRLGRDAPDAIRLGYLKFMGSDQPIKAEGFKAMVDFFNNTYRGNNMVSKAATAVFKPGAQVLGTNMIPDHKDREKLDKTVTRLQKDPSALIKSQANEDLGHYLPNHQMAMTESATRAFNYLQGLKPHPVRPNPFDSEIPPSKAEEARYHRALDIAQQPAIVLDHVKNGTLQASDIKDLSSLYPQLYKSMSQKLSDSMIKAQADNIQIPYHTRMSASLFLGQPMDTTMIPMSIVAAQPKPQASPQQGPAPKAGGKSMSKLGKTNKSYMTPLQASEADRGDRS